MQPHIKVATAQRSPNHEGASRGEIFERTPGLLERVARAQLAMSTHPSCDAPGSAL